MGIDVYMSGSPRLREELGWHGRAGYLRESYHGGPYAIPVLLPEGWERDPEEGYFPIAAATLRERLPATVFTALARQAIVYGDQDASTGKIDLGDAAVMPPPDGELDEGALKAIRDLFSNLTFPDPEAPLPDLSEEQHRAIADMIAACNLPQDALEIVDFVELAERQEREIGEPVEIWVDH
jgi:hypothetical protein